MSLGLPYPSNFESFLFLLDILWLKNEEIEFPIDFNWNDHYVAKQQEINLS